MDENGVPLVHPENNMKSLHAQELELQFFKMALEEEISFIATKDDNIIQIKYQIDMLSQSDKSEMLPLEIKPDFINITLYEIQYDNTQHQLQGINSTRFGPVKYKAIKRDEECGYVEGSVMNLWSTILEPGVFNLLHAHIDDLSEEVIYIYIYIYIGDSSVRIYEGRAIN